MELTWMYSISSTDMGFRLYFWGNRFTSSEVSGMPCTLLAYEILWWDGGPTPTDSCETEGWSGGTFDCRGSCTEGTIETDSKVLIMQKYSGYHGSCKYLMLVWGQHLSNQASVLPGGSVQAGGGQKGLRGAGQGPSAHWVEHDRTHWSSYGAVAFLAPKRRGSVGCRGNETWWVVKPESAGGETS